jgi:hypothetical protein
MKLFFSIFIILSVILGTIAISRKGITTKIIGSIMLLLPIVLTCISDYNLVSSLAIGLALGYGSLFLIKIRFKSQKTNFKWSYLSVVLSIVTLILFFCLLFCAIYKQIILLLLTTFMLVICSWLLSYVIIRNINKTKKDNLESNSCNS